MSAEKLTLMDADGTPVAEIQVTSEANDWFVGRLLTHQFPTKLQKALAWYDEVVENQMLSYLDEATEGVEHFGLRVRFSGGDARKVFSLHIHNQNEVSFRTSPVPPPAWLAKSARA